MSAENNVPKIGAEQEPAATDEGRRALLSKLRKAAYIAPLTVAAMSIEARAASPI